MAAGALKFLHESGIRIPEDVAVVGYDNNDICLGLVPSLTTVDQHSEKLGKRLAQALLSLIHGKTKSVRETVPPALIERASHQRSTRTNKRAVG